MAEKPVDKVVLSNPDGKFRLLKYESNVKMYCRAEDVDES